MGLMVSNWPLPMPSQQISKVAVATGGHSGLGGMAVDRGVVLGAIGGTQVGFRSYSDWGLKGKQAFAMWSVGWITAEAKGSQPHQGSRGSRGLS